MDGLSDGRDAGRAVTGLVLAVLLVSGPLGVVDLVEPRTDELGDGTAAVTVVEPDGEGLRVTDGRFGTGVSYLRLTDLVVDVNDLEGRPRVVYSVAVPALGVDETATQVLTREGRVRLGLADRALSERPSRDRYEGYLEVRVQSFSGQRVVVNRTLEVTVG